DLCKSMTEQEIEELLEIESRIANCSDLMRSSGIFQYQRAYPNDPYLNLWLGLVRLQENLPNESVQFLLRAMECGFGHFRLGWYLAIAAIKLGQKNLARDALTKVIEAAPAFSRAKELLTKIDQGDALPNEWQI
ncbi:MAG: hypothetical protein KDD53_10450, partial [Bdellovibrionales bacterium]|nr:hypothetical protein [Bdellovibrionales bacterium]